MAAVDGTGHGVRIEGLDIALFHWDQAFYALENLCPHLGFPLTEGMVQDGTVIHCESEGAVIGDNVVIALGTKGGNKSIEGSSIAILPYNGGAWGAPNVIVESKGATDNNFFPVCSPDSKWIAYVNAAAQSKDAVSATLKLVAATGGTPVTVKGSGFSAGPVAVKLGGARATDVAVLGDTLLTCVTPPGSLGQTVTVSVQTRNGVAALVGGFTYEAVKPQLVRVTPDHGPAAGGKRVTVIGSGFTAEGAGATVVTFGSVAATNVAILDDGSLACDVPAGAAGAQVNVTVQNENGAATLHLAAGNSYAQGTTINAGAVAVAVAQRLLALRVQSRRRLAEDSQELVDVEAAGRKAVPLRQLSSGRIEKREKRNRIAATELLQKGLGARVIEMRLVPAFPDVEGNHDEVRVDAEARGERAQDGPAQPVPQVLARPRAAGRRLTGGGAHPLRRHGDHPGPCAAPGTS